MIEAVFFYALAALMLGAALSVVCNRRPMHSVLSLLLVMCCLASLFVMLGAYFVAALQILLSAGAVLVLFLFVIMLLRLEPEAPARMRSITLRTAGIVAGALLGFALLQAFKRSGGEPPLSSLPVAASTVEAIARALFTTYLLPFELTSFLILGAIIGAVTLAKRPPSDL